MVSIPVEASMDLPLTDVRLRRSPSNIAPTERNREHSEPVATIRLLWIDDEIGTYSEDVRRVLWGSSRVQLLR